MVITILAPGSRGDTQPYIALGLALKQSGYNVRIAAFENYETFITQSGLGFVPVKGDVTGIASSEEIQHAAKADNPLKFFLSFQKLKKYALNMQKDLFEACKNSDLIIYHPGAAIGYFAAQHFNIPSVLASPFPMTPTREYPALIFYDKLRLGKTANLISHKIFEQIFWSASSSPVKQFWKKTFGKPPEGFTRPYSKQTTRKLPTIVSSSNAVFTTPPDWPQDVHNTGYWFLDQEPDWKPSRQLQDFLDNGPAPIYFGFGSISDTDFTKAFFEMVIPILEQCGQRGILATGWSGVEQAETLPENVFMLESAPHAWLFPQMAAVVHHGGAGTTSAGFRAGVPSIIIPFSNDQFAWGRRAYELGVASKPIPRKKLTPEKLSAAIQSALSAEVKAAARNLGNQINAENGAQEGARIIIDCLQQNELL